MQENQYWNHFKAPYCFSLTYECCCGGGCACYSFTVLLQSVNLIAVSFDFQLETVVVLQESFGWEFTVTVILRWCNWFSLFYPRLCFICISMILWRERKNGEENDNGQWIFLLVGFELLLPVLSSSEREDLSFYPTFLPGLILCFVQSYFALCPALSSAFLRAWNVRLLPFQMN